MRVFEIRVTNVNDSDDVVTKVITTSDEADAETIMRELEAAYL